MISRRFSVDNKPVLQKLLWGGDFLLRRPFFSIASQYEEGKLNPPLTKATTDMKRTHLTDSERIPIPIAAHKLYGSARNEVIHLCFRPGEVLEKHSNPFDVIFYVLEGIGILEVDEQSIAVGPDTLIEVSAPELRGWTNTGNENLRVLVIKVL